MTSQPSWTPEPADVAAAAITRFAAAAGKRSGRDLSGYGDLLGWSVRDLDSFWGLGVQPGDRVVGYLPNVAATIVAFLSTASIGAVWSACAQDYAATGAAARFAQLAPVVLVAADGYRWNGRAVDRRGEVTELQRLLPSLRATVYVRNLGLPAPPGAASQTLSWSDVIAAPSDLRFEPTAFDAPLWILFSSGTTGRPKGIVHGHGGIVVEHCKLLGLHLDLGPDRPLCWYTTANWMMWNIVVAALLVGAPIVLYDGSPTYPDPMRLWRIAADRQAAVLGVSPGYLTASAKAGLRPGEELDLTRLRTLGVTGAPLTAAPYSWVRERIGKHVQTASTSGGTDIASGFAGSSPTTPVWAGEMSAPLLGVALESWDDHGRPRTGHVGELVVTRPMPSMPLSFWDDPDGQRYLDAYFGTWPGVWRHGDWVEITGHGSVIVSGRSDATLNRNGVRLGSADIYTAIEALPQIADSLVIGAELGDGAYWLVLFVVLTAGIELSPELTAAITTRIAAQTSPRHVPDEIIAVPALPHTRSGKRLEVPVKRLIQGQPLTAVASADAVDDFAALAQFTAYAGGPGRPSRKASQPSS
jgi:acetoacetyl-CoA synthetase